MFYVKIVVLSKMVVKIDIVLKLDVTIIVKIAVIIVLLKSLNFFHNVYIWKLLSKLLSYSNKMLIFLIIVFCYNCWQNWYVKIGMSKLLSKLLCQNCCQHILTYYNNLWLFLIGNVNEVKDQLVACNKCYAKLKKEQFFWKFDNLLFTAPKPFPKEKLYKRIGKVKFIKLSYSMLKGSVRESQDNLLSVHWDFKQRRVIWKQTVWMMLQFQEY